MDVDQYRQQAVAPNDTKEENGISTEKWKPFSAPVDESENNPCGGFDCNICLDSVQDPVVTLCGHLYCWPCIYKWIHFQSLSLKKEGQQKPQCPVCKAEVSRKTLVPLYGRSEPTTPSEGKAESELDIVVPKRPPSPSYMVHTGSRPTQQLHYHPSYPQGSQQLLPVLGVYGQTLYARLFVNSETTYYTYPYSYRHTEISSPRVRRHMMRADESLSRICFFLICVVVFFLFLF